MLKEDFTIQSNIRRLLVRSNIDYSQIMFGTVKGVVYVSGLFKLARYYSGEERENAEEFAAKTLHSLERKIRTIPGVSDVIFQLTNWKKEKGNGSQNNRSIEKATVPLYLRLRREFEDRVRIHPNYADLHNQCGLLFAQSEDWPAAEKHFKEALRLNPKYREASLNLGYLYLESKQWDRAENLLVPESRRHPGDSSLHHVLAVSFLNTGKDRMASRHFRKAASHPYYLDLYRKKGAWKKGSISLDPKGREVLMTLRINYQRAHFHNFVGLYLAKEGRAQQAVRELRKAAMLKPDEFLFHANLGTVYYHQGVFGKAVEEYREAVKMDPRNGMGYAYLSYAYGLMRRNGQALRAMEKATQLCPRYADLHYNLALLYSDRRRYAEAVAELKKALQINPSYLFARINLGVLYEDMGRWKEAIKTYEKILRITPEDDHIRHRLEGALKRQHRPG